MNNLTWILTWDSAFRISYPPNIIDKETKYLKEGRLEELLYFPFGMARCQVLTLFFWGAGFRHLFL